VPTCQTAAGLRSSTGRLDCSSFPAQRGQALLLLCRLACFLMADVRFACSCTDLLAAELLAELEPMEPSRGCSTSFPAVRDAPWPWLLWLTAAAVQLWLAASCSDARFASRACCAVRVCALVCWCFAQWPSALCALPSSMRYLASCCSPYARHAWHALMRSECGSCDSCAPCRAGG
jgi:hypothetical protein